MKKICFALLFSGLVSSAYGQFELKTNPIALLFEVLPVSVEYSNLDDWGGQLDLWAFGGGVVVYGSGKYYLSPKMGADRFHLGAFLATGFSEDIGGLGLGFNAGYKVVSAKRVLFEIALGVGRGFGTDSDFDVLPYGALNVGYRFKGGKSAKQK